MIWIVGILVVCVVTLGVWVISQTNELSELQAKHIWASNEIYTLKTQLEAVPRLEAKVAKLESHRLEQVIPKKRKEEIRASANMKLTEDEQAWKDSLVKFEDVPAQMSKEEIFQARQDRLMRQASGMVYTMSGINLDTRKS